MSGVNYSFTGELINIKEVTPLVAGTPTYALFRWRSNLNLEVGVFEVPIPLVNITIGPVLTATMSLMMDGRAMALLEKESSQPDF